MTRKLMPACVVMSMGIFLVGGMARGAAGFRGTAGPDGISGTDGRDVIRGLVGSATASPAAAGTTTSTAAARIRSGATEATTT